MENPFDPASERGRVWEQAVAEAYRDALLDVYDFMTGNPTILSATPAKFALLQALAKQINDHPVLETV